MNYEQLEYARRYEAYLPWKERLEIKRAEKEKLIEFKKKRLNDHIKFHGSDQKIDVSAINNNLHDLTRSYSFAHTCHPKVSQSCVFKAECQEALKYYNLFKKRKKLKCEEVLKCLNIGKCGGAPWDYNEKCVSQINGDVRDWGEDEKVEITMKSWNDYDEWKDKPFYSQNTAFHLLCGICPVKKVVDVMSQHSPLLTEYSYYIDKSAGNIDHKKIINCCDTVKYAVELLHDALNGKTTLTKEEFKALAMKAKITYGEEFGHIPDSFCEVIDYKKLYEELKARVADLEKTKFGSAAKRILAYYFATKFELGNAKDWKTHMLNNDKKGAFLQLLENQGLEIDRDTFDNLLPELQEIYSKARKELGK